jgi:diguanylate cyclase (GGDEF)-like protein
VDVNDLKRVNVAHGREVGDQVLRDLVRQIRASLRAADVLFRLESDEFAALLLQTDGETADLIASRMRGAFQKTGLSHSPTVGVTLAVATAPADGRRIEELIESARRRLTTGSRAPITGQQPPRSVH